MPATENAPTPTIPSRVSAAKRFVLDLIGPIYTAQGDHLDPTTAPPPTFDGWTAADAEAFLSAEMEAFRTGLRPPGGGEVRDGVVADLSAFYELTPEECVARALTWEEWSVEEWSTQDRSTPEGLRDFYRSTASWSFDLLWYAYLQSEGYGPPMSVAVVRFLADRGVRTGSHLDFGSGAGVTSQLFEELGFATTLADVADGLLAFARSRLERRSSGARFINLNEAELPVDEFDVVTAFDVLAHVPDLPATLGSLRGSIRPGGWLFATFDVRAVSAESAWHLYDDDWELCANVVEAGFLQRGRLGTIRCYQRVEPSAGTRVRARWVYRNPALLWLRRVARTAEFRRRNPTP